MRPATIVLIHSPLGGPADWGDVGNRLGDAAAHSLGTPPRVLNPSVETDDRPPYATRFVASVAQAISQADPPTPILLVGYGEAGPLLPAVGFAQRAARRRVGGYVFVDALLPRPGTPSHLDLLAAADPELAEHVHEHLHGDGLAWPPQAVRPRAHDFWTEPLPHPPDWPDAPCGYLDSARWPASARLAASRAWTVKGYDSDLVAGLVALITAMPG